MSLPRLPRTSARPEHAAAGRPGAPAGTLLEPLGDADLRRAAGLAGDAAAAHGPPGRGRELQPAVVAVAGFGLPVAARLAACEAVPDTAAGSQGAAAGQAPASGTAAVGVRSPTGLSPRSG